MCPVISAAGRLGPSDVGGQTDLHIFTRFACTRVNKSSLDVLGERLLDLLELSPANIAFMGFGDQR